MRSPKGSKPPRITSFAADEQDEKNIATVKEYLGTNNQSVAIRFSLKETAHRLVKLIRRAAPGER